MVLSPVHILPPPGIWTSPHIFVFLVERKKHVIFLIIKLNLCLFQFFSVFFFSLFSEVELKDLLLGRIERLWLSLIRFFFYLYNLFHSVLSYYIRPSLNCNSFCFCVCTCVYIYIYICFFFFFGIVLINLTLEVGF